MIVATRTVSGNHKSRAEFDSCGATVVSGVVDGQTCDNILPEINDLTAGSRLSNPSRYVRDLMGSQGALGKLATELSGQQARPVRILAFDKSPQRNWKLGWHQDRVIAVKERVETPGFDNWTRKANVPHVEPPQSILERMFSLRLHLDNCGPDNGALKIVPESWRQGRVEKSDLLAAAETSPTRIYPAERGDVLAMRALTFHASDAAEHPTRRRVLHIDYATCELPGDLDWFLNLSSESPS